MENQVTQLQLRVPPKTLTELSFCSPDEKSVAAWINSLPKANIGETSRLLYSALIEINKFIAGPEDRFRLIELLRPTVYYTLEALSKHYLGQTVVLNAQQKKVANLAQALQVNLATGYKHVILDNQLKNSGKQLAGDALHRAMSEISRALLRTYQLYCPPPKYLWLELGQLYSLAVRQQLVDHCLRDEQNTFISSPSLQLIYNRAVLLGCSRANQLRQADLQQVFNALELWAPLAEIQLITKHDPLFFINLESDHAPCYFTLSREPITRACRGLDSLPLMQALQESLKMPAIPSAEPPITIPKSISTELLKHLIQAWGPLKDRSFKRMATDGELQITSGFSATHYVLSGNQEFHLQFLPQSISQHQAKFNSHWTGRPDAWSNAFDADNSELRKDASLSDGDEISFSTAEEKQELKYQPHTTQLFDTSPSGYCIVWPGNLPPQTQAGELIGVRESGSKPWCLAVIRWIKVESPQRALMGVELLTPNARPCALSLLRKSTDRSQPLRAFWLPEINAIAQPATLITPARPFEESSKIALHQDGKELKGQLTRKVMGTRSFSQFEFQLSPEAMTQNTMGGKEEDFTSVWKII